MLLNMGKGFDFDHDQQTQDNSFTTWMRPNKLAKTTLQIYTAGNGTHVKNVKVTSICRRYYNVEV